MLSQTMAQRIEFRPLHQSTPQAENPVVGGGRG